MGVIGYSKNNTIDLKLVAELIITGDYRAGVLGESVEDKITDMII